LVPQGCASEGRRGLGFAGKAMLLPILKFVGLIWLAVLVTGIVVLAALHMFDLAARAIRRRLARRR
jgi:hypothetical protein